MTVKWEVRVTGRVEGRSIGEVRKLVMERNLPVVEEMKSERKDRGKIAAQLIEAARANLDDLDRLRFGECVFYVKQGNVYRMEIRISGLLKEKGEKKEEEDA